MELSLSVIHRLGDWWLYLFYYGFFITVLKMCLYCLYNCHTYKSVPSHEQWILYIYFSHMLNVPSTWNFQWPSERLSCLNFIYYSSSTLVCYLYYCCSLSLNLFLFVCSCPRPAKGNTLTGTKNYLSWLQLTPRSELPLIPHWGKAVAALKTPKRTILMVIKERFFLELTLKGRW